MPGDFIQYMKVRNKANTLLLYYWILALKKQMSITIEGKSGSPLIELDAFDEETFTVDLTVPEDANNGDKIPISITASPLRQSKVFLMISLQNLNLMQS